MQSVPHVHSRPLPTDRAHEHHQCRRAAAAVAFLGGEGRAPFWFRFLDNGPRGTKGSRDQGTLDKEIERNSVESVDHMPDLFIFPAQQDSGLANYTQCCCQTVPLSVLGHSKDGADEKTIEKAYR